MFLAALVLGPAAADAGRRSLAYAFPQDDLRSFRFQTTHRVTTDLGTLPPEASAYDVAPVRERLADVTTRVDGRLERMVARVFRDSSLGVVSRLVDLKGEVERPGGQAAALDLARLEGKSVSMRLEPGGGLLDSTGWEHILGGFQGGHIVADVLAQSVLRLPRELPAARPRPTSFRVRVPVDSQLNRDQTWVLSWTRGEAPAECGRRCLALDYHGSLTEAAKDQHPARPMEATGAGTAEGTIVLGPRHDLRSHEWRITWEREVTTHRSDGSKRARVTQSEVISGSLIAEEVGR